MVNEGPVENSPQRPAVIWSKSAYRSLKEAYEHIRKQSPANAEKVKKALLDMTRQLAVHPERYPLDKFKKDNPGNYRAFEKYSYRVAYLLTANEIIILRLRHVRKDPKSY